MVDLRARVLELFRLMELNFLWSQELLLIKASLASLPRSASGRHRRDAAKTIDCSFIVSTFIVFSRWATQIRNLAFIFFCDSPPERRGLSV